jgi:hypothetical protein
MRPTLPGIRLASVRAGRSRNSIGALVLCSSPGAQCASASRTAGSRRSSTLPRAAGPPHGPVRPLVRRPAHWSQGTPPVRHWPSEPLPPTGWASRSPARTTSSPVTMAGRRPAPLASRPSRFSPPSLRPPIYQIDITFLKMRKPGVRAAAPAGAIAEKNPPAPGTGRYHGAAPPGEGVIRLRRGPRAPGWTPPPGPGWGWLRQGAWSSRHHRPGQAGQTKRDARCCKHPALARMFS